MAKLMVEGALTHKDAALLRIQLYSGRYGGDDIDYAISRLAEYDENQRLAALRIRDDDVGIVIKGTSYSLNGLNKSKIAATCAIAAMLVVSVDIIFDAIPLFLHH